jgi:hypothetical protein
MKFITKTESSCDLEKIKQDLNSVLSIYPWPNMTPEKLMPGNQIGLTHRPNAEDVWLDSSGSLYDKKLKEFVGAESDFSLWNPHTPTYTRQVLEALSIAEKTKFGRIRFMRLMPKTGLSIHADFEKRYHLVIETNTNALFGEKVVDDELAAKCYHIPADGYFYKVDTTKDHFVYNGGWEPRIHLVICEAV